MKDKGATEEGRQSSRCRQHKNLRLIFRKLFNVSSRHLRDSLSQATNVELLPLINVIKELFRRLLLCHGHNAFVFFNNSCERPRCLSLVFVCGLQAALPLVAHLLRGAWRRILHGAKNRRRGICSDMRQLLTCKDRVDALTLVLRGPVMNEEDPRKTRNKSDT